MNWFFNLVPTLRARLFSIAAVMAVLTTALVLLLLHFMRGEIQALESMYVDRVVPLKQLKVVADAYAVNIVDATHKVRNGNITWEEGAKTVAEAKGLIDKEMSAYLATHLVPEEKRLIAELKPLMQTADADVTSLNALLAAKDEAGLGEFAAKRLYQSIDPVGEKLSALVQLQLDVAKQIHEQAEADYTSARNMSWVALGAALLLGGGLAWLISRRIRQSLGAEPRQLREFVTAIGEGDLTQRVEVPGGDSTSVAANAERMQTSLRGLVSEMRDRAQELRVSAEEISAGNMDLSSRTEQTASAMAAAASQLREVMERVRSRSGHLGDARSRVANTALVADNAGQQMGAVIETMRGINDSARRIGDIIGTIDGIAFQTNILALNAAVEAARAGEAGRGFAVVAGEVRLLAQRSAEAAREIKSLISASMERTDAGARQVDDTGATLQDMVRDVQKLAELVGEIAAGAQHDDRDMGQVLDRLGGVDQAVQQNAALVEQMAASSQSLNDQSAKLADAAQGFRV